MVWVSRVFRLAALTLAALAFAVLVSSTTAAKAKKRCFVRLDYRPCVQYSN